MLEAIFIIIDKIFPVWERKELNWWRKILSTIIAIFLLPSTLILYLICIIFIKSGR